MLYLGAASGTTVSHCSDVVGPEGTVYAVEFSHRSGRDLIGVAKRRTNVIPIVEDARYPLKYRMLVGMVDVVCTPHLLCPIIPGPGFGFVFPFPHFFLDFADFRGRRAA